MNKVPFTIFGNGVPQKDSKDILERVMMGAKTMSAKERCEVQARYIKELEAEVLRSRRKLGELKGEVQALHETSDLYNDEINALKAENARLREALVRIRGWREIGRADTLGEKLRAIEDICDDAIAQQEGE